MNHLQNRPILGRIMVTSGGIAGEQFDLPAVGATLTLGRDPRNHIAFDSQIDKYVSRSHARITSEAHGIYIVDLDSRGGTFVNGRPIREAVRLEHGCQVQLGDGGPCLMVYLDAQWQQGSSLEQTAVLSRQQIQNHRADHMQTMHPGMASPGMNQNIVGPGSSFGGSGAGPQDLTRPIFRRPVQGESLLRPDMPPAKRPTMPSARSPQFGQGKGSGRAGPAAQGYGGRSPNILEPNAATLKGRLPPVGGAGVPPDVGRGLAPGAVPREYPPTLGHGAGGGGRGMAQSLMGQGALGQPNMGQAALAPSVQGVGRSDLGRPIMGQPNVGEPNQGQPSLGQFNERMGQDIRPPGRGASDSGGFGQAVRAPAGVNRASTSALEWSSGPVNGGEEERPGLGFRGHGGSGGAGGYGQRLMPPGPGGPMEAGGRFPNTGAQHPGRFAQHGQRQGAFESLPPITEADVSSPQSAFEPGFHADTGAGGDSFFQSTEFSSAPASGDERAGLRADEASLRAATMSGKVPAGLRAKLPHRSLLTQGALALTFFIVTSLCGAAVAAWQSEVPEPMVYAEEN